jgi:hypothetical protein
MSALAVTGLAVAIIGVGVHLIIAFKPPSSDRVKETFGRLGYALLVGIGLPAVLCFRWRTSRGCSLSATVVQRLARPTLIAIALGSAVAVRAAPDNHDPQGFAPPRQNLFHPLLSLGPPGSPQAALDTFATIMNFERKLVLHPAVSPELQTLIDKLPPPETIIIEVPALYSDPAIPWQTAPPKVHYLSISGRPDGTDYVYGLTHMPDPPLAPGDSSGTISIRPARRDKEGPPETVIAEVEGSLHPPGRSLPSQGMAAWADLMREVYGSLEAPWDAGPGRFNQHDRAALARFARDMPALAGLVGHYFHIYNVLDEFSGPTAPWVLLNLNAEIRDDALAPFPYLYDFYRDFVRRVEAETVITDGAGRQWLRMGLNHGRITVSFIVRKGMITPMHGWWPAGPPCPLEQLTEGHFYADSSVAAQRFGLKIGLDRIRYATSYSNRNGAVESHSRMTGVPRLIAPPIVHGLTMLVAGQFIQTLARGNSGRGIATSFSAQPDPHGGTLVHQTFSAEFRDSPALILLVRLAGAITPAHDAEIRADERRLGAQFFDALASDLNRARPALLNQR